MSLGVSKVADNLDSIAENIRQTLSAKDEARGKVLPQCRDAIRHYGNAIQAVHRQKFDLTREQLQSAHNVNIVI
jgi:predicted translin family RNA/ssDNA-binding protein